MQAVFDNYSRQKYRLKELIIVLNDDSLDIRQYEAAARPYMNVKIIRRPGYVCNMANRRVPLVQGATLLIRRKVFRKVAFPDRNRGECVQFCRDSAAQCFRIYAGGPYHFLAIRNPRSRGHTWIVSDKKLLSRHARAIRVKNIKKFISRG